MSTWFEREAKVLRRFVEARLRRLFGRRGIYAVVGVALLFAIVGGFVTVGKSAFGFIAPLFDQKRQAAVKILETAGTADFEDTVTKNYGDGIVGRIQIYIGQTLTVSGCKITATQHRVLNRLDYQDGNATTSPVMDIIVKADIGAHGDYDLSVQPGLISDWNFLDGAKGFTDASQILTVTLLGTMNPGKGIPPDTIASTMTGWDRDQVFGEYRGTNKVTARFAPMAFTNYNATLYLRPEIENKSAESALVYIVKNCKGKIKRFDSAP